MSDRSPAAPLGEIGNPPLVRAGRRVPLSFDQIGVPSRSIVTFCGHCPPASADDSDRTTDRHQPANLITAYIVTSAFHRMPQFPDPVEPSVGEIEAVHSVAVYASSRAAAVTLPRFLVA